MLKMKECILSKADGTHPKTQYKHYYQWYRTGERVSHTNRSSDFAAFISRIRRDTKTVTGDTYGLGSEIDPVPTVIKLDCAMELLNGCILGYRTSNQIDSGKLYNNVTMLILFWYDGLCHRNPKTPKNAAVAAISKLLAISPSIFKWCDSHVY